MFFKPQTHFISKTSFLNFPIDICNDIILKDMEHSIEKLSISVSTSERSQSQSSEKC